MAWCPSPGCEHAVEARTEVGSDPMDITCRCGATFCFQCKEEAHRPVRATSAYCLTRDTSWQGRWVMSSVHL